MREEIRYCENCNKTMIKLPKWSYRQFDTKRFCSISCKAKKMIPPNFNHFKGGRRITEHGYIYIFQKNHPNKTKNNCVLEHRLVMEKHIGRLLEEKEVVHHINGITSDNRIDNLKLLNKRDHDRLHAIENGLGKDCKSYRKRDLMGRFL